MCNSILFPFALRTENNEILIVPTTTVPVYIQYESQSKLVSAHRTTFRSAIIDFKFEEEKIQIFLPSFQCICRHLRKTILFRINKMGNENLYN